VVDAQVLTGVLARWARLHPWAASYIAVLAAVAAFTGIAAAADWDESVVVLFALCAVAMGGFLLDHLRRPREGQGSQRAQTE
jgi:hypothetical protein